MHILREGGKSKGGRSLSKEDEVHSEKKVLEEREVCFKKEHISCKQDAQARQKRFKKVKETRSKKKVGFKFEMAPCQAKTSSIESFRFKHACFQTGQNMRAMLV